MFLSHKENFMGKVVVITGASSGIGLAAAKTFLQNGWKVYGVALNNFQDGGFKCFQADVNDAQKMKAIFDEVQKTEGHIDCLVNNAGFGISGEVVDHTPEQIKSQISTNLTSSAVNLSMVGKMMRAQGYGKIINTCSLSALFPLPYQACYSATKAGIDVLTRTTRTELKKHNVYVCDVLPGDVHTGFSDARQKSQSADDKVNKSVARMEGYERKGMSPQKVANKIFKLASKKHPRARVCVGSLKLLIPLQKVLPTRFLDWLIAKIYC